MKRFDLKEIQDRPDAYEVIDANGRLLPDHPDILVDPILSIRGQDGTIREVRQSELEAEQAALRDANMPKGATPNATAGIPITPVTPPQPADAGQTQDFSASPFMVVPFTADQGVQSDLANCWQVAVQASFAKLHPDVLWTNCKQIGPHQYRTRFYLLPNAPATTGQTAMDVFTDDVLATAHADLGVDGSKWGKVATRAFAYARTGANTYHSLDWGWAADTMTRAGVLPTSYATNASTLMTTLMASLTHGIALVASSNSNTGNTGIIPSHVYSIDAVRPNAASPEDSQIDLDNPWGGYGIVTITLRNFRIAFGSITVGTTITFATDGAYAPFAVAPPIPHTIADLTTAMTRMETAITQLSDRVNLLIKPKGT